MSEDYRAHLDSLIRAPNVKTIEAVTSGSATRCSSSDAEGCTGPVPAPVSPAPVFKSTAAAVQASFENIYCSDATDQPAEFILMTNTGAQTAISRELLVKCAFFQNVLSIDPGLNSYTIDTQLWVLNDFCCFLRGEHITDKLPDVYPAVRFGLRIVQEDFIKWCILRASGIKVPRNSPEDEVIDVVVSITSLHPLRAAKDYSPLVEAVKLWSANDSAKREQSIRAIMKAIGDKVNEKLLLPGIPFFMPRLTAAIMEVAQAETFRFVVFMDGQWNEIDALGTHFASISEVKGFYLVPNTYIVYRSHDDRVIFKDLRDDSEEKLLLSNCMVFRSLFGTLRIVEATSDGSQAVFAWNHEKLMFDKVFCHKDIAIRTVSACRERQFNVTSILTEDNEVLLFDKNNSLVDILLEPPLEDYIPEPRMNWKRPSGCGSYLRDARAWRAQPFSGPCWRFAEEFHCGKWLTHMGFRKLAVQPLSERLGYYRTLTVGSKTSTCHGRIACMSDMYLCDPALFR